MNNATLNVYRLVPDAAASDPNWDLAGPAGDVVVRAHSPADARIVAAEAETDFLDVPAKPGDGVSTSFASVFRDDKLYTVVEDTAGKHPREGPRGVIEGLARRDAINHAESGPAT